MPLAVAVCDYLSGQDRDAEFACHGISRVDVDRAIYLATVSSDQMAADERRVGVVLSAIRAPGCCVETVEVITRVTDEEPAQRDRRWADVGFFSALMGRDAPALPAAAADHVRAGRTDFLLLRAEAA